jgi:hypothetical protein
MAEHFGSKEATPYKAKCRPAKRRRNHKERDQREGWDLGSGAAWCGSSSGSSLSPS